MLRGAVPTALTLPLLLCTACGGSSSPPPRPTAAPSSIQTDPCAPPAPSQQPALHVCLGGAISGSALVPSREATSCTGQLPGSFSGTFVTLVNSTETRLELTDNAGVGAFRLDDPAADTTVTVVQAGERSWSSIAGTGTSGTLTVAADRSGSLDVTLGQRDLTSGAEVAGAPALRVRGTFRCPA